MLFPFSVLARSENTQKNVIFCQLSDSSEKYREKLDFLPWVKIDSQKWSLKKHCTVKRGNQ
jgi:hypothetical protein